jgi:hypothetical protein
MLVALLRTGANLPRAPVDRSGLAILAGLLPNLERHVVLTIDTNKHTINTLGEAAPIVRAMVEDVAEDKVAFRDAKLRLGWMLRLLREEFRTMPFEDWLEVVGLRRRTAYHAMRVAEQLADDQGRFSADKYRARCRERKKTPAARPQELTLRQIEMDAGLRCEEPHEGNMYPCAPPCTRSELVARIRAVADALESAGLGEAGGGGGVDEGVEGVEGMDGVGNAVAALEVVVRRVVD